MLSSDHILHDAFVHFESNHYGPAELDAYAKRIVSRGLPETWPEDGLHAAIIVMHNVAQGFSPDAILPHRHCCGEFGAIRFAFYNDPNPNARYKILKAAETWFPQHRGRCGNFDAHQTTFREFVEAERRREQQRVDAERRAKEQASQHARAKAAELKALQEAEEERKRREKLAEERRIAAQQEERRNHVADEFVGLVIAAAQLKQEVIEHPGASSSIRIILTAPILPAQALIDAARQVASLGIDAADKKAICNRLIEAAYAEIIP